MNRTGRRPRIHIPNTIHHVMIRGNNRQRIFFNARYFKHFLKIIEESTKKFDHKILAFCLMSNHAHLLIHIHNDSLSNVMKNINYRYARWLNYKQKRIGHLFQGRYRSIDVDNETYIINLCRYIHYNPVEAKMVDHPSYYAWSSHHYYYGKSAPDWMETNLILTAIKNKTSFNYQDFIDAPIDREKWKPGLYISQNGDFVIDEDVVRNLYPINNADDTALNKTEKIFLPRSVVSKIVCKNLHVEYHRLSGASRDRKTSFKRIVLAHFWLTYSNLKILDIAKELHRTHGTLLRQLNQLDIENNNYLSKDQLQKIQTELDSEQEQK